MNKRNHNPEPVAWGSFSTEFINELSEWIGTRRVLEVFAGNGLLASKLAAQGVDITATSILTEHDGHEFGMQYDVIQMEALTAVRTYGDQSDILLMSWPVASEASTRAILNWDFEKPIVFIGEVTDLSQGFSGLGGCASDTFFEITNETSAFSSYQPRNMLDRAAIRCVDLVAVLNFLEKREAQEPSSTGFTF